MGVDRPTTPSYRFGPFRIDPIERRLWRDDVPVPLTPKMFDVLLALVENSGHLLEKDALMKRVGADAFVEEANLANNISLLRKVLAEGGGSDAEYIETVPRRGYRFLAAVTKFSNSDSTQPVPVTSAVPVPDAQAAATRTVPADAVLVSKSLLLRQPKCEPGLGYSRAQGTSLRRPEMKCTMNRTMAMTNSTHAI